MCLLFFKLTDNPGPDQWQLILINTRDEYIARPTAKLAFWPNSDLVGARDLETGREGGTWLAINRQNGRIGNLLNILQCDKNLMANAQGRGQIVTDYLNTEEPIKFLNSLANNSKQFNGFVFIGINLSPKSSAHYVTNISQSDVVDLPPGIHAFGNSINPGKPWNKVIYGRSKFESIVSKYQTTKQKDELIKEIFDMLRDNTELPYDDQMREQANTWPDDHIVRLNRLFVQIPEKKYGTRTWSIILVDGKGNVDYIEKTRTGSINFTENEIQSDWETTHLTFQITSS